MKKRALTTGFVCIVAVLGATPLGAASYPEIAAAVKLGASKKPEDQAKVLAALARIRNADGATDLLRLNCLAYEGQILCSQRKVAESINCLRQTIKIDNGRHLTTNLRQAMCTYYWAQFAEQLAKKGRDEEALEICQLANRLSPRFGATERMVEIFVRRKEYDKALSLCREILATKAGKSDPSILSRMYLMIARVYHLNLKDNARAEATYKRLLSIIETTKAHDWKRHYSQASSQWAEFKIATGRRKDGVEMLLSLLSKDHTQSLQIIPILLTNGKPVELERAAWQLREIIALSPLLAQTRQAALVDVLLRLGKPDEALAEARAYFYICLTSQVRAAADKVAQALKAKDESLVNVNRFLRFVTAGPAGADAKRGTEDDLDNVLASYSKLDNAKRTRLYREALDRCEQDWQGLGHRAVYHLLLEEPAAAYQSLTKAFALCPSNQGNIQTAADAVVQYVYRFSGDSKLAERKLQFMVYGEAGRDGKAGTKDDLADPSVEIERILRFGELEEE